MAKAMDSKKLKDAVNKLNGILETGKIKQVGKKTEEVVANFKATVLRMNEEGKVDEIPDDVLEFFNDYVADDEDGGEEKTKTKFAATKSAAGKTATKSAAKPVATKSAAGKPAKVVVKKADGEKKSGKKDGKSRARSGSGMVAKAVEAYEGGIRTTKELTAHLMPLFPDRPVGSTVSHVVCILGHVKALQPNEK